MDCGKTYTQRPTPLEMFFGSHYVYEKDIFCFCLDSGVLIATITFLTAAFPFFFFFLYTAHPAEEH